MSLFPPHSETSPRKAARRDFLCCLCILLFTGITYYSNIWDLDFFWQLATGRWIVENAALPNLDPFGVYLAATGDRAEIILKGYWLCQILYFWIYSALGYAGFALLKALTFITLIWGQFLFLRKRGVGLALAALQSLLVYTEFLAFRADRPQIFAYGGMLLVIVLIELRHYRWVPLVMIIWANIHGSFLVGVVIIGIYAAVEFIRLCTKTSAGPSTLLWYLAAAISAGINPNHLKALPVVIFSRGGAYEKTIFEYISPLSLALQYNDIYWGYFLVLSIGAALIIILRKRIPLEQMVIFTAMALLSLSSARYIPFLLIYGSIYTALWASPLLVKWADSGILALAAFSFMAIICIFDLKDGRGYTKGIEHGRFPVKATEFINKAVPAKRTYCNTYWGGYLLWASPGRKISSDSRALSIEQYMHDLSLLSSPDSLRKLSMSGFDTVLTSAFNPITGEKYLLWQLLANSPQWQLAYADETALVFVKRERALQPPAESLSRALDHALNQSIYFTGKHPETLFHWLNLADIYLLRNQPALAMEALGTALKIDPDNPEISNRLILFQRGIY